MSMSTTNSGAGKIYRAINHIESAARLIASLPAIYHQGKERRVKIREIVNRLQELADEVRNTVTKYNIPPK